MLRFVFGSLMVLVSVTTLTLSAAEVPLDLKITFEPADPLIEASAALVIDEELQSLLVSHRRFVSKYDFPIGGVMTRELQSALQSRFERVELLNEVPDQWEGPIFELESIDVQPKFPRTTFGAYRAVVSVVITISDGSGERVLNLEHEGSNKQSATQVLFQDIVSGMQQDWVNLGKATGFALLALLNELIAEVDGLQTGAEPSSQAGVPVESSGDHP